MHNDKSDNTVIMMFNLAGVVAAYALLALSLYLCAFTGNRARHEDRARGREPDRLHRDGNGNRPDDRSHAGRRAGHLLWVAIRLWFLCCCGLRIALSVLVRPWRDKAAKGNRCRCASAGYNDADP